ncbi:MAG: COG3650 family protein [Erythrobacter sp.]
MPPRHLPLAALMLVAAACTPQGQQDGIDPQGKAFDAVPPDETVTLTGTEPFWTLTIERDTARWTTPENPQGTLFAVTRFAGNGGLGFTGSLDGKPLTAALTPGACNDGMSDRRFPFVATIALGGETLQGCGYTTGQPFTGGESSTEGARP